MTDVDQAETETKPLRPNERRVQTDIAFREIAGKEAAQLRAKSERLKQSRLEADRRDRS